MSAAELERQPPLACFTDHDLDGGGWVVLGEPQDGFELAEHPPALGRESPIPLGFGLRDARGRKLANVVDVAASWPAKSELP